VSCSRHQVRTAPESPPTALLSAEDAEALRDHYDEHHDDEARFFRA
jgi:hypothetical protein